MKQILLTQGQVAIVDDWRFDELSDHKWHAQWRKNTKSYYATYSTKTVNGKRKTVLMHVVVARTPTGMHTDHINHNTLDNREGNLRAATASQNGMNRRKLGGCTSIYIGVHWSKRDKCWYAQIYTNGKYNNIGAFRIEEEAARAYDAAAKRLHGEFASLNFKN